MIDHFLCMMTRLDVLSHLPSEVRGLIRRHEANMEDNAVLRHDVGPGFPYMGELARLDSIAASCIKGLLSLYYQQDEVEDAYRALGMLR